MTTMMMTKMKWTRDLRLLVMLLLIILQPNILMVKLKDEQRMLVRERENVDDIYIIGEGHIAPLLYNLFRLYLFLNSPIITM